MTLVVDASAVVAGLVDAGEIGSWAADRFAGERLAAPHLMPVEVANILRKAELVGEVSAETAALAYADLVDLPVDLYPFEPFGQRVWSLRHTVSAYDAWYVAVAEAFGAVLVTIDIRLALSPGPICEFVTPPLGGIEGN